MRWWDAGVRVRVGLIALNALALAAITEGFVRGAATLGAGILALLIARSLRSRRPAPASTLPEPPKLDHEIYLGRGFEWTLDALQETLDTGAVAVRPEHDLTLPVDLLSQHLLCLGTTGTGKTRLLELLALQAIERGEAVVIIDPKGDDRLLARVRAAAGARFRLLSLPHPEKSVHYNPIARYREVREVADRVAALLPSSGDALPFRNFGWEIIHTAAQQLDGKRPMTFRNLKRLAIDHPEGALAARPREHHLKMASALVPALSKLSLDILCPKEDGLSWEAVDRDRLVVYFALGSLLGGETSSAVAKMALLDLQSFVGARYAYSKGHEPIWLFVDELGDVVTREFISILNKSRGAGLRIVGCAQTAADLEAALGNRAQALQVLGNTSTVIQFRALSATDAETFSEMSGQRLIQVFSEAATYEPALMGSGFKTVDDFRARFGTTIDSREHALVPPWAVIQLPALNFFARWDGRVYRGRVPLLQ